jgi:HAMP domain-containing protein
MEPPAADDLANLQKELRARLRRGGEAVALTATQCKLLLDELGRLAQSNERLRRQNRRVRRRLHGDDADAPPDPPGSADAGADAEATP